MLIAILSFIAAAVLSFALVPLVRRFAVGLHVLDLPEEARGRKVHAHPTPLLGGLAIFLSFFIIAFFFVTTTQLLGIFLGGVLLMIGGFLDDRYRLPPLKQVIWPLFTTIVVLASGVGITAISNPFGGPLGTEQLLLGGYATALLTFLWLMGMMYTTKFLDGLDGLVSGITVIGALIIALLSLNPVVAQRETAILAFVLAGAFLGFLFWNWHPAKIFLGEGGALFAGFMLGVLSIISGSKVAATALVFGIPIIDVAWVILRRIFWDRRSPFRGDRTHLHFRLLDIGFSQRKVVTLLYFLSAYFGITALFLQSRGALVAFVVLSTSIFVLGLGVVLIRWLKR